MPHVGPFVGVGRRGSGAAWSPLLLSPSVWYEPGKGGLFQSNAGTTAASANGDVVGYMPDQSGNSRTLLSVADNTTRPTLQGVGSKPYLSFDGSNDLLKASTATGGYAAGAASWFMAIRSNSNGTTTFPMGEGQTGSTNTIYSILHANANAATTLGARVQNDSAVAQVASTTDILSFLFDGRDHVIGMIDNGSSLTPYVDGVAGAAVAYTRSGSFTLNILAMGGLYRVTTPSSWWAGRVYGAVCVNRVITAGEIASLTEYLTGLYQTTKTVNSLVATRCQAPTGTAAIALNATCRREHRSPAGSAITAIQTVDIGLYGLISPTNSSAYTIKRYIEYPAGTFTQVTWSSSATVTVSAGGVTTSDSISISIPADTKFWIRTVNVGGAVAAFPQIVLPANATTLGVDDGVDATDKGNSGTIAASAQANFFGPAAIIGTTATSVRSFLLAGDSLTWGQGDITSVGSRSGSGYMARALDATGYPYCKMADQGHRAALWRQYSQKYQAFLDAIGYTDAICQIGVNDLSSGSSTTQLTFDLSFIANQIAPRTETIAQTTLTPKTSSSDSWAVTGNQTASTTGNMAAINTMNGLIRTGLYGSQRLLEVADAAMSARDSKLWALTGVAGAVTTDGVHPTSLMSATMGSSISSSV